MYHSGANVDSEKGCSCEQEGIWELTVEPKTVVKSSLFKSAARVGCEGGWSFHEANINILSIIQIPST
jgi:hypothetical protein